MFKFLFSLVFVFIYIGVFCQNLDVIRSISGSGDIQVNRSVIDSENNIYLTGYFNGIVSINGTEYTSTGTGQDAFVSKFDKYGNFLWFKQISSDQNDYAVGLALTTDNLSINVIGYYFGSLCNFGDGITLSNFATGTADAFLVSLKTSDGSVNNAVRVAYGPAGQVPSDIVIDNNSKIIITGYGVGNSNQTFFDASNSFICIGPRNYFLLQLNPDYSVNWFKHYVANDANNNLTSIDFDNTGYYIAGINKGTINLDIATLVSQGNTQDMFLLKTDFYGNGIWLRSIKGNGIDVCAYSTCDQKGNIFISGFYASTDLKVDSTATLQSIRTIPNKGSNDIFFAKYTTSGTLQWFDVAGSSGDDRVTRLSTDGEHILIAGQYGGEMTFNNKTLKPIGGTDALGIVHDKDDNLLYAITAGGTGNDVAQSCVIDNEGNYVFTGNFYSPTLTFDATHTLTNATPSTRDVFIAKYKARSISFVTDSVLCPGTNTASVTANPEGAWSGKKTYLWSKEGDAGFTASTPTIENVGVGIYTCTISDGTHTENASVTVVDPAPLAVTLKSKTDASCFGSATGHLEVNVTGGTGAKKYLWSGTGTGVVATNPIQNTLSAGTYGVTVTDKNGCPASLSNLTISEPKKINFKNTTVTNLNPSNGAVNLSVQEGTPGYSYNWTGPSGYTGATTEDLTGLTIAGLYSVTVNDAQNCSADTSVLVALSSELRAYISQKQDVSCNGGSDGILVVTAETGKATPNFEYSWSGPDGFTASTATIANLKAGTYTVTVTDINNAPDFYTINNIIVNQPTALSLVTTHGDAACTGVSNGYIDIDPAGGTLPYTYQWKKDGNTLAGNTEVLSDLAPGNYEVTITDAHNCSASASAVINPASAITVDAVITNVTCIGTKNDGAIALNITGGSGTKTVRWSNGLTSNNISLLSPGTYICTVTDQNNCSVVTSHTVGQPSPITATFLKTNISCFGGSNGAIDLTPSGGNGSPYSFKWEDNSVNEDRSGLSAGTYSVTITDSRNCEKTLTETLTQPQELNVTASLIQNVNCNGKSNGSISLSTTGGILPYNWVWSDTQTGPVASGLAAGTYSVTVTDNNSCSKTASFDVTEPSPLVISEVVASHINVLCHGLNSGILEASASGSSGNYQYSVDGNTWKSSGSFSGIPAGVYTVVVRDQDVTSCTSALAPVTITEPQAIAFTAAEAANITCFGLTNGSINSTANGGTGTLAYKLFLNDVETGNVSGSTSGNFTGLGAGSYKVEVTDANNCGPVLSSVLTITEPQAIALTAAEAANITCFGLTNGSINSTANGGTGTLAYKLFLNDVETGNVSGSTSGNFTGLGAGSYKVEVTDANNCGPVLSSVLTITEPQAITFRDIVLTNITCSGLNNGSINAPASGGTGTLIYHLDLNGTETGNLTGQNNGLFTGLSAGTSYEVKVSDANNCTLSTEKQAILEPSAITINNFSGTDVTCPGLTNGTITVNATGGTGNISYRLMLNDSPIDNNTGLTSGNFTDLPAGTKYVVEVTDGNNCGPVKSNLINVNDAQPVIISNITATDISCSDLHNGTINIQANGGKQPLNYRLLLNHTPVDNTTGTASGVFSDVDEGKGYTIEVTDANNCGTVLSSAVDILKPLPVTITSEVTTRTTGAGKSDGTVDVAATGGTGALIFKLNTGSTQSNGLFSGLPRGTYSVTVTDANNCGPALSSSLIVDELTMVEAIRGSIIRFYPNPASGKIFLEVKDAVYKEFIVEIRNITSQAALVQKFENVSEGFTAPVDISHLPRGIYVIMINNIILNDKLILQ